MSLLDRVRNGATAWGRRKARLVIVATHLVIIGIGPIITSFGLAGTPATGPAVIAIPLGLAVLALQLRHSFAIARGRRPRGLLWSLLALLLLVYLPLPWFGWNWWSLQVCVMASLPLVLRGWPLVTALAVPVLATDWAAVVAMGRPPLPMIVYAVVDATFTLVVLSAALYGSARLVRVVDELQATRAELAELEVGRERLRVSRDLHDLLGQSLSAVSLKGDLAIRLLRSDPPAAKAEIEGLTGLARDALRGVREARECSIIAGCIDGRVRLEIVNDGAQPLSGEGSGLTGLAERARGLAGSVSAGSAPDGRFRLEVDIPREAP
jgi:two-component system, NarL family, sensor histidine kinase DesK